METMQSKLGRSLWHTHRGSQNSRPGEPLRASQARATPIKGELSYMFFTSFSILPSKNSLYKYSLLVFTYPDFLSRKWPQNAPESQMRRKSPVPTIHLSSSRTYELLATSTSGSSDVVFWKDILQTKQQSRPWELRRTFGTCSTLLHATESSSSQSLPTTSSFVSSTPHWSLVATKCLPTSVASNG